MKIKKWLNGMFDLFKYHKLEVEKDPQEDKGITIKLKFNRKDTAYLSRYIESIDRYFDFTVGVDPTVTILRYVDATEKDVDKFKKHLKNVCDKIKHPITLYFFRFDLYNKTIGCKLLNDFPDEQLKILSELKKNFNSGIKFNNDIRDFYIPIVSVKNKEDGIKILDESNGYSASTDSHLDGYDYPAFFTLWGVGIDLLFNGKPICEYNLMVHKLLTPSEAANVSMPNTPFFQHYREFIPFEKLFNRKTNQFITGDLTNGKLIWLNGYWRKSHHYKRRIFYDTKFFAWYKKNGHKFDKGAINYDID